MGGLGFRLCFFFIQSQEKFQRKDVVLGTIHEKESS